MCRCEELGYTHGTAMGLWERHKEAIVDGMWNEYGNVMFRLEQCWEENPMLNKLKGNKWH